MINKDYRNPNGSGARMLPGANGGVKWPPMMVDETKSLVNVTTVDHNTGNVRHK
jgi:hypothetical protein